MRTRILFLALAALVLMLAVAGAFIYFTGSDVGRPVVEKEPTATAPGPLPVDDDRHLDEIEIELPSDIEPVAEPDAEPVAPSADASEKKSDLQPGIQSSLDDLADALEDGGQEAAERFASERGLKLTDGRVQLVIEASDAVAAEAAVSAAGGIVETTHEKLVQALVPLEAIDDLSALPTVDYVREPEKPALAALSEGVADSGVPVWQSAGFDGTGVKVAVIDFGFQDYQALSAAGDLPASVTTASFRADGDITGGGEKHGSACAEIVHDIAPGAELYLVNFITDVELANAIDYVISQDIDVVSASWSFFGNFRGDGQGPINDMVQDAHDNGIFWANVSGNAAMNHWSGAFTDSNGDNWHEFATGDDGNDFYIYEVGAAIDIYLTWDKWPVTDQDYDIYLYHETDPELPVAGSTSWQGGSQPPSEQIHYTVPQGKTGRYWVQIDNFENNATGDASFKLYSYPYNLQYKTSAGSLAGQPTDSPYVMTVGAAQVNTVTLEPFSARGPTVDGRIKPDIVAPDRVSTASYGVTGFWGTSASAPHVAGAGALVAEVYPAYTPAQVQAYLEARATDLGVPGKDNLYGSGKLNLGAFPVCFRPLLNLGSTQPFWASYQDFLSRELSVTYTLCNQGKNDATNVVVAGSSNTNGVAFISGLPLVIGDLVKVNGSTIDCADITVKYLVPFGVESFKSTSYLTALDSCSTTYEYPGPYIGPSG